MRITRLHALAIFVLALSFTTALRSARPVEQIPAHSTNLQVLPKDATLAVMVPVMKQFTSDLKVRCEYCHKGEGNDLSAFDFASDDRPAKKTARAMMKMTAAINGDLLNGVGAPSTTPKVTCYTCHRGTTKPLTSAPADPGRGGANSRR